MTPERKERLKAVAALRQSDFTVVLENVTDMHNVGAVLRTCDSVGIPEVYIVMDQSVEKIKNYGIGQKTSSGARKWVDVHAFDDIEKCLELVKAKYGRLIGTIVSDNSDNLYDCDFLSPGAIIMGNEHAGMSTKAQAMIDQAIYIPQMGMVKSLNISVSCAISLYEMLRQRNAAKMYRNALHSERSEQLYQEYTKRHEQHLSNRAVIRHF
jgi:tRNA (guanosine-2'-O-)-methyltransferase